MGVILVNTSVRDYELESLGSNANPVVYVPPAHILSPSQTLIRVLSCSQVGLDWELHRARLGESEPSLILSSQNSFE